MCIAPGTKSRIAEWIRAEYVVIAKEGVTLFEFVSKEHVWQPKKTIPVARKRAKR
jgi:hypothetical protein